jgi:metal-sulfur cluster biosynthetic enzyme
MTSASGACRQAAVEDVRRALTEVLDPEYPINIVDMGLVRGVAVDGATVRIRMTYTSMGCPCMEMIQDDVREAVLKLPGVERVELEVTWEPWSRRDITAEGWQRLRGAGVV